MLSTLFPAEKTRFVLPLVRASAQHQRLLLPDTAAAEIEPGILECLSKIQAFGISVKYIDGGIILHILCHVTECCQ